MDPNKTPDKIPDKDPNKTPTNNQNNYPTTNDPTNNAAELDEALAVAREAADAAADAAEHAVGGHANTTTTTNPANPYARPTAPTQSPATPTQPIDTPEQPPYDPFASKTAKKSHKGKIAAIIIIVILLLAGIGGATWLFAFYNQPERIALDAMTKLLNAEHVTLQGTATSMVTYEDGDDAYTSTINLNASYNKSGAQQIELQYSNDDFAGAGLETLALTVQRSDGQLFVQTDGLDELLATLFYSNSTYCDEDDTCYTLDEDMQVESETDTTGNTDESTDEETATDDQTTEDATIVAIDDTWLQIDPETLVAYFGYDETLGAGIKCLLSDNIISDLSSGLASAYAAHPFLIATEYTGSEYRSEQRLIQIDYDATALADFTLDFYNNSFVSTASQCDATINEISADDARDFAESIAGAQVSTIVLAVDFWSHELTNYYTSDTESDDYYQTTATAEVSLSYPTSINISAPDEYEDITTLLNWFGIGGDTVETLGETYLPNIEI